MLAIIHRLLEWLRFLFWAQKMEMSVIGLQKSGKTTFINVLSTGEYYENTIATIGFNTRKIRKNKVSIKIWDIGGQKRFRSMWERYCRGVDAIVYMVDCADTAALNESKEELHSLLEHEQLASIPLLVLGNKSDLPEAISQEELINTMDLHGIGGREVCCYSISCKEKYNIDITLKWLTSHSRKN